MQTHVTYERQDDLGYLIFACDEAGKPTTLDRQVLDELAACLDDIEADVETLRAVIVQADPGPRDYAKYFMVGANINALQTLNAETIVPWIQKGHAVFNRLEALPMPVIAKVEGYALGGGLELAMACDLIVAAQSAKFGQPEANLGLVSGWGGSYRLPRRVGVARAKAMFFTGEIVDAEAAFAMGLVDFVGDAAAVEAHLNGLLDGIRKCGAQAVAAMKQLINDSPDQTLAQNCAAEAIASSLCMASPDTQARVATYLAERRKKRGSKT